MLASVAEGDLMTEEDLEARVWTAMDAKRGHAPQGLETLTGVLEELGIQVPARLIGRYADPKHGDHFVPDQLGSFMVALGGTRNVRRVVDPWCGIGQVAAAMAAAFPGAEVVGITSETHSERLLKRIDTHVSWTQGDVVHDVTLLGTSNDLVVCVPPFNARVAQDKSKGRSEVLGERLLEQCVQSLSPDGQALFVLTRSSWTSSSRARWQTAIAKAGYHVRACFSVPAGWFAPNTGIPTILIQVAAGKPSEIFVAEVPGQQDAFSLVLTNLSKKRSSRDARLGRWVASEGFVSLDRLILAERIEELGRRLGSRRVLGDIARIQAWQAGDEPLSNSVLLPASGSTAQSVSWGAAEDTLRGRYWAIAPQEDVLLPEYLVRYLNSELGQLVRQHIGAGATVSRSDMADVLAAPIYLPDLETQRGAIRVSQKIGTLVSELTELNEKLWSRPREYRTQEESLVRINHEDRFEQWLESLPFPLATILWLYVTQSRPREAVDTLLHFFEAYAEFWATSLLSMFLRDTEGRNQWNAQIGDLLRKQNQSLDHASFGTWMAIVQFLTSQGRAMWADQADGRPWVLRQGAINNPRTIDLLFNKKLQQVLGVVNGLRNTWKGHSGVVSDDVAETQLATLRKHLGDVRSEIGENWAGYVLYRAGELRFNEGVFTVQAERVMGTRAPFAVESLEVISPTESGKLHLVGTGTRDALPLLPLVRLMPSPKTASNACYFYNRKTKDGVRFVSYHFAEDSDVTQSFDDTAQVVARFAGTT